MDVGWMLKLCTIPFGVRRLDAVFYRNPQFLECGSDSFCFFIGKLVDVDRFPGTFGADGWDGAQPLHLFLRVRFSNPA